LFGVQRIADIEAVNAQKLVKTSSIGSDELVELTHRAAWLVAVSNIYNF
jgi:hypothetical protein